MKNRFAFTLVKDRQARTSVRIVAFTLAEVLITLAIIGIIAALTIPNLVQSYKKRVVETRLARFYSLINQAITLSEIENGSKMNWNSYDINEFWNIYLKKYLKYLKTEDLYLIQRPRIMVYLEDGSAFLVDIYKGYNDEGELTWQSNGGHFLFCPYSKDCSNIKSEDDLRKSMGTKIFTFGFWPNDPEIHDSAYRKYHYAKGVEPYKLWWDGNKNSLYTNCLTNGGRGGRHYCCAIIQMNGWKIPDDYPLKF